MAEEKRTTWSKPVNLDKALAGDPPPAPRVGQWTDNVDGKTIKRALFYPNEVHSVFGDPEAMKSWLLLLSAVQEVKLGNHVFFVDMEANQRSIVDRLKLLGANRRQIKTLFHYFRPEDQITGPDRVAFRQGVTKYKPTLVVLDGVTEAFAANGLSLNSAEDAAVWFSNFARQFQLRKVAPSYDGPAIVELDHVVKNQEARNGWALGTIHKKAGIKGAAYQVVSSSPFGKGKHGRSRLYLEKDSPGGVEWIRTSKGQRYVGDLHCDATGSGGVDAWIESPDQQASLPADPELPLAETYQFRLLMQEVSAFIAKNAACSTRRVRDGVVGTNEHIATAVEVLVAEGYVRNEGNGRGHKYVSIKDFTAMKVMPGGGGS